LIGLVEKQSIYKNSAHVEERAQAGNAVLRRYIHGPGADAPLVWYEGPTTTDRRWLIPDERGSIIAITNASGTATNINRYDGYGVPAPTNTGRFQYTGQAWVPELSMYYYKARIYAPTLGRFMQTDPTGYDDGPNWYDYVGGDPVNKSDPTGLLQCGKGLNEGGAACEGVLKAGDEARSRIQGTIGELKSLRDGLGGKLSTSQQSMSNVFKSVMGANSVTASNLNRAISGLSAMHDKIGARGQGMTVSFSDRGGSRVADAALGGNSMTIYRGWFSPNLVSGAIGTDRASTVIHESGHAARGVDDLRMLGYGGGMELGYGRGNAHQISIRSPKDAWANNSNLQCVADFNRCGD
jgi:RHS repeat-associated protein